MSSPNRYDQLGPIARALVDDYDAFDLAELLVKAQDELAALRTVARGYCPACGRGDCSPSADQWYEQRKRADRAEAALAHARTLHQETCPLAQDLVRPPSFTCSMCDTLNPAPAATEATDNPKQPGPA